MQCDCAFRIAGRGHLTSFSVEYKTGNQSLFECAESFTKEELRSVNSRYVIYTKTRHKPPSTDQSSRRPPHHKNARVQPNASSSAIRAQVASYQGAPVSSRTIRRRQAEGHLGSRRPLRMLPLTHTHRHLPLEWCHARGNWTAAEWNQVVFSDESRFNLSSDDNRVRL
ncbi:HTH_Tnp_Tc3_2 domain-containing protein [Trichonephila clavipes]|nr:HTH_Tnp_Tc3_2 domain-containing protein [Trichonephila clavipes]